MPDAYIDLHMCSCISHHMLVIMCLAHGMAILVRTQTQSAQLADA